MRKITGGLIIFAVLTFTMLSFTHTGRMVNTSVTVPTEVISLPVDPYKYEPGPDWNIVWHDEFKSHYELPKESSNAIYAGHGYIEYQFRGACFLYKISNQLTHEIPCNDQ